MNVKKTESRSAFVSRGGDKLASVADKFELALGGKAVLDVGSSTGGFTDFALRRGAAHVIAVDAGTNQLHPSLRNHPKIELFERTDIRDVLELSCRVDYVFIDVSFISITEVLRHLPRLINKKTEVIGMVKPQFETMQPAQKNHGIIKNETVRRTILKDFELRTRRSYRIVGKADSAVLGDKGNKERFYRLRLL